MIIEALQKNTLYQYADLLYRIASVSYSEKLSREALEKLRRKRFEALLHHVFAHSPFYNDLYRSHQITPADIPDLQLHDLPLIDKTIMMDHFDDFVCDTALKQQNLEKFIAEKGNRGQKYLDRYQVIHTSGSSGKVGIFIYDMRSWNITKAMAITRVSKAKLNPFKKIQLAFVGATDGHYAGISLSSDAPTVFYNFKELSVNRPMHELIEDAQLFSPSSICGYSSGISLLAHEQLKGNLDIHPQSLICSGDKLTEPVRKDIQKAFGVNPRNFYAASESLCMAAECDLHQGLHMFEDWHYFEVLDDNFKPVAENASGSLVLTTLHNFAQPLIRYQIHDHVVLDPQPCRCGRSSQKIKMISGRREEFLWFKLPNGEEEYLPPSEIVEFFIPGLQKFQLEQTAKNHLHMRLMAKGEPQQVKELAAKRMQEILSAKQLDQVVTFSSEVVSEIPLNPKTGKFNLILPFKKK